MFRDIVQELCESRWPSWAIRSNRQEPYGFRGCKIISCVSSRTGLSLSQPTSEDSNTEKERELPVLPLELKQPGVVGAVGRRARAVTASGTTHSKLGQEKKGGKRRKEKEKKLCDVSL